MNWLKVFRIVLITDSVVLVLKLALPILFIGYTVQWIINKGRSDNISTVHLILVMANVLLLTFILFRLVANYYQYRNERHGCHKINCSKSCCCGFCCGCCWLTVCILSIALMVLLTWLQLIHKVVGITYILSDVVFLCAMVIFKSLMNKITYPHVVQYKRHNSKEEINA